jgi:pimeloyl-ACP methyl ester carboxylesterase
MKLVLLPGLDGTGDLFQPFIDCLSPEFDAQIISYSTNKKQNYHELSQFVVQQLPKEKFIIVAESFSGYIAYQIALLNLPNLVSIVFVASFLESPKPLLLKLSQLLPMGLLFSLPLPKFIFKQFLLGKSANNQSIQFVRKSIKKVKPQVLAYRLNLIKDLVADEATSINNNPTALYRRVNAIYLQAKDDKLVPKKCFNDFQKLFPQISLHQINGSHFLLQSQSKLCAKIVNKINFEI